MPGRFITRYNLPKRGGTEAGVQLLAPSRDVPIGRINVPSPLEDAAKQAALIRAQSLESQTQYRLRKEMETDQQKTAFYNGLQEVEQYLNDKGYKIGTKEHAEAFAAYAHEFPLARSSKTVQDTLKTHAAIHDDQSTLSERMNQSIEAGKQLGLEPQGASFIKGGQVDVRFKQPDQGTDFEDELQKGYKLSPGQFAAHVNAQLINAKGEGDNAGNLIKFTAGESNKGEAQTHTMTLPEFNRFATAFGMQPIQQQAPSTTPAPSGVQAATNYGQQVGAQPDVAPSVTPAPIAQPSPDQTPIYAPPPSPEATATPTHLGTYNPATGEFE